LVFGAQKHVAKSARGGFRFEGIQEAPSDARSARRAVYNEGLKHRVPTIAMERRCVQTAMSHQPWWCSALARQQANEVQRKGRRPYGGSYRCGP
jgi:hypothetical protein